MEFRTESGLCSLAFERHTSMVQGILWRYSLGLFLALLAIDSALVSLLFIHHSSRLSHLVLCHLGRSVKPLSTHGEVRNGPSTTVAAMADYLGTKQSPNPRCLSYRTDRIAAQGEGAQ